MSIANKNIIDLLNECTYNPSFKDYIIKILIDLSYQRGVIFYKTVLPGSQSKIVAIKYPITIRLKGNPYELKIIIYIISDFPDKSPDIYIDNSGDPNLAVNPKNLNVNPENFKVITNKLFNWKRSTSIQEILVEIINSFEKDFPIYKKTANQLQPQNKIIQPNPMINNNINNMNLNNFSNVNQGFNQSGNMWNYTNQSIINTNSYNNQGSLNKNPAPVINNNFNKSMSNSNINNCNSGNFNNGINNNMGFNPSGNINNQIPNNFGFNNQINQTIDKKSCNNLKKINFISLKLFS
jgi:hypothetical protein